MRRALGSGGWLTRSAPRSDGRQQGPARSLQRTMQACKHQHIARVQQRRELAGKVPVPAAADDPQCPASTALVHALLCSGQQLNGNEQVRTQKVSRLAAGLDDAPCGERVGFTSAASTRMAVASAGWWGRSVVGLVVSAPSTCSTFLVPLLPGGGSAMGRRSLRCVNV